MALPSISLEVQSSRLWKNHENNGNSQYSFFRFTQSFRYNSQYL